MLVLAPQCFSYIGKFSPRPRLHSALSILLKRLLRPSIAARCQRLEWKCSCGRAMYGDYSEYHAMSNSTLFRSLPECEKTSAGSLKALNSLLRYFNDCKSLFVKSGDVPFDLSGLSRPCYNAQATNNEGQNVSSGPASNDRQSQSQSRSSTSLRSDTDISNTSENQKAKDFSEVSNSRSSSTLSTTNLQGGTLAFFELCVNGSKGRVSLGEIALQDGRGKCCIKTDMHLFSKFDHFSLIVRRLQLTPGNVH